MALRWLVLGDRIAWGTTAELPQPLEALAIAPGGYRAAGVGTDGAVKVVALGATPTVVGSIKVQSHPRAASQHSMPAITAGFPDDEHAVACAPGQVVHVERGPNGWIAQLPTAIGNQTPCAYGAGVAVAAQEAGLALGTPAAVYRYLGYRDLQHVSLVGGGMLSVRTARSSLVWLDDDLRALRTSQPSARRDDLTLARALGDRHLVAARRGDPSGAQWEAYVRDAVTGVEVPLATAQRITGLEYDPPTGVLAVHADREVLRYRIGLAPLAATPLRTLDDVEPYRAYFLTDPTLARGVSAMALGPGPQLQLVAYALDDDTPGPAVRPQTSYPVLGTPIAVDRSGTVFITTGIAFARYRDGKRLDEYPLKNAHHVAVTRDGARFAAIGTSEVVMYDGRGVEQWRRPMWQPSELAWSPGDRRLVVSLRGGLEALDPATGDRLAVACGWNFGLFDASERTGTSHNTASACAAP